jgi:hypothetical protein
MQTVDILGDHTGQTIRLMKPDDRKVTGVGLHLGPCAPELAVDVHPPTSHSEFAVGHVSLDGEVVGIYLGPETVRAPEVGYARFGAETGTTEDEYPLSGSEDLGGLFQ